MRTVQDVYSIINTFSPFSTQEKWDNSGLLVGTGSMPVHKVYVTLDISNETIAAAQEQGADLMVAHHPIIFSPLKQLSPNSPVWKLAAANMAAIRPCKRGYQGPLTSAVTRTVAAQRCNADTRGGLQWNRVRLGRPKQYRLERQRFGRNTAVCAGLYCCPLYFD